MAKKQISKKAKRRLTVLTPIAILAVGYLLFTIVTTGIQLYQLNHEEKELKEELKNLKGDYEDLKIESNKLKEKDYIASYARENYSYTKDGEFRIKIKTNEKEKEKTKENLTIKEEYIIYGGVILGILIILYILRKIRKRKKNKHR
ncbi:MAG: septum formation initiator family protein [Bacilli bacterium]|nr:septum formation initiator family protein [Bacilli bacterium]